MKQLKAQLRLFSICLTLLGISSLGVCDTIDPSRLAQARTQWNQTMRQLCQALEKLLPMIAQDSSLTQEQKRQQIFQETKKLSGLAQKLTKNNFFLESVDPSIQILAQRFEKESKDAVQALKKSDRSYAVSLLRAIPNRCASCHTMHSAGGISNAPIGKDPNLNVSDRGRYFVASRQFDRAQEEFMKLLKSSEVASSNPFAWEKAVYQSLAIAIRVKRDPNQALCIIQTILDTARAPLFLRENAKQWKISLEEWRKEPLTPSMNEESLYAAAKKLMAQAREIQKYPMDRSADILYLRVTALIHQLLQLAPKSQYTSEAFLLAGLSYEVLRPLQLEDLHDIYYESCIRRSPHTLIAQLCYQRYEESIFFEYTGSRGTDIPKDIQDRLKELKNTAYLALEQQ